MIRARTVLAAILGFVIFLVPGIWAILQSRSSTAGIGFLFLPFYGLIPALGAVLASKALENRKVLHLGLGLALIIYPTVRIIQAGVTTREKNQAADRQAERNRERIAELRMELKHLLASMNEFKAAQALDEFLATKGSERLAVVAALERPELSGETLERLLEQKDQGLVLNLIRHPKVTGEQLRRLYQDAPYKWYLAVDLARNPRTPPEVLELVALEHNLFLPRALLDHTLLNCTILKNLESTLRKGYLKPEEKAKFLKEVEERKGKLCSLRP